MPQAIVAAAAWIGSTLFAGTAVGAFLMLGVTTGMASAVLLIGGLAYSSAKARQAKQQAKDQYNAAQVDRLVNISSAVAPRELVLGRVRKGGTVIYKASTGSVNRSMFVVIALAAHEVDAIEQIYLNDVLVDVNVDGGVTTAPYWRETNEWGPAASYLTITKHLGQPGQTVDPQLLAAFPADWSAANTLTGIAYLVVKGFYAETAFPSGFPNVTAVVRGAKLYDPRTGLTVWSENPALMLRHVYSHAKFGKASVTAAEDTRIIAAANACDSSVSYGGAAACALYRAALVLPFGTAAKSAFDDLAQAMGGSWAYMGGALYLKAGVYTSPVLTLTDADLAVIQRNGAAEAQQPIAIAVHKERAQKFNTVKASIWDQAQDYKQVSLTPLAGSALVARDGVELVQEVTFPAIGYAAQALHVAGVMMRDARDPLMIELPCKLSVYHLELFDNVAVTLPRYGWLAKVFTVLGRTWNSDGSLQLTLKETSAAITQMDATFAAQGFASNTNLPKPWEVATVGALTLTSGTAELLLQADGTVTSRMRVTWPVIYDQAVLQSGQVEVQYRRADYAGEWSVLTAPGADTSIVTEAVQDRVLYHVRARAKTRTGIGAWTATVLHQVIGKTAPPLDVAGLAYTLTDLSVTFGYTPSSEADYAGTVVRVGASWATGVPVSAAWLLPAAGTYTAWAKHLDTSGNESLNAVSLSVTVPGPSAPVVTYALSGPDEILSWTIPAGGFTVDRYEIRQGASWAAGVFVDTTKATGYRQKVTYADTRTYWVAAIDMAGNVGTAGALAANITSPGTVTAARADVVDNNALVYWAAPLTGSLPVERYEVRKGASWAAGSVIGSNGNSTFTAVFEQSGGTYTYWVAAVDSAGNYGPAVGIMAVVNQPPDYILRADINSVFDGAKSNALPFGGGLLLPVNTAETWAQHFANNGYATPQDQITAGKPLYIEPNTTTASYTEAIDYGTTLPATTISVTLNSTPVAGSVVASCQIQYSNTSASGPWTDGPAGATSCLATNFRWVRVVYSFTAAAGTNLLQINALNVKLAVKNRSDSGVGTVTDATNGLVVNFGYAFIDADSPMVQPQGATPLIAVVDFTDTPNPTSFRVYLYTMAGVKTTGSFSWLVRGY